MDTQEPQHTSEASSTPSTSRWLLAAGVVLVAILILGYLGLGSMQPPAPKPADAPATEFSAQRAMEHVRAIASEPHPTGSLANQRVRDYLLQQLTALGLEPQVQRSTVVGIRRFTRGQVVSAEVENVLARIPGQEPSGKALLLAAHYDSVTSSPGAADDGAGVAAILETIRALKAGAPLKNDVVVLFTDGEEIGLYGSLVFMKEHPWAQEVAVALNFEARGNRGASIMFRTSDGNGWLLGQLAAAAPAPVATSLSHDVFKRMPNDTDFSEFKAGGLAGMDFAFIGDLPRYHTMRDTSDRVDVSSVQHHGSYMLSLARRFGNLSLNPLPAAADVTYFNFFSHLVVYPMAWVLPLAVVGLILWVVTLVLAVRWGRAKVGAAFGGWFGVLLAVAAAAIVCGFALQQVFRIDPRAGGMAPGVLYHGMTLVWGLLVTGVGVCLAVIVPVTRKLGAMSVALGAALLWLIFALVTAVLLPGASYLFLWPALLALVAWLIALRLPDPLAAWLPLLVLVLGALPALALVLPVDLLIIEGLSVGAAPVLLVPVLLAVGLLVPLVDVLTRRWAAALPVAVVVLGILMLVVPVTRSGFSTADPRFDNLFYCQDADESTAFWASSNRRPGPWSGQFLGQQPQRSDLSWCVSPPGIPGYLQDYLFASAPMAALEPPVAEPVEPSELGDDGIYRMHVRLRSPRGASMMRVGFDGLGQVVALTVNDKRFQFDADRPAGGHGSAAWLFTAFGPLGEGIDVKLEVNNHQPLELILVDQVIGLPAEITQPPRPEDTIPPNLQWSDSTMVRKSYMIP